MIKKKLFYTTQLQAGLGLVDETKSLLEIWETDMSSAQLVQKALSSGSFPNVTARRLRNIISECFSPRYLVNNSSPAKILKKLEGKVSNVAVNQFMFLQTARANLVLADFVKNVYWTRYGAGYNEITTEDAQEFVKQAVRDGKTQKFWSETTIKRVSSYLLGCCVNFGLLESATRSSRQIKLFRVQEAIVVLLAYELHLSGDSDSNVLNHPDWALFGLEPEDVKEEFKRMALKNFWIIQTAGEVISISWLYKSIEEVVNAIIESGL